MYYEKELEKYGKDDGGSSHDGRFCGRNGRMREPGGNLP